MSVLMACARHYTLRTTSGHVIKFAPDVPVSVPDSVVHEALAVNILPVDGKAVDDMDEASGVPRRAEISGLLRDALALRAISDLVRENDAANFGGGVPKVAVLNTLTGLSLTAAERMKYWEQYRELKGAGEDMPSHKALDTILEVQALSTPSGIKEYAKALDVDMKAITGHPMREQKQILLSAAIKA